jgi:hypothetical protein
MRVPIALVLAALGMAAGACAAVERGPSVPYVVMQAPDAVPATATGVVVTAGTGTLAVRRRFCRPQPWCRWRWIRGPRY